MTRVVLVTQSYHPVRGGVGEHVHHLALGLLARGHEVTVLTGGVPGGLNRGDSSVPGGRGDRVDGSSARWSEDEGSAELLGSGGRLVRAGRTRTLCFRGATVSLVVEPTLASGLARLDRRGFDLVHVHSPFEPLLPIAAVAYFRAPCVGTFHSAGMSSSGYLPFLPLLRPVASRLSARIAVSAAARDHVARFFPGDYRIVPNGVDPARFRSDIPRTRREGDPLRILALGRLDPRKGHRLLLRALSLALGNPALPPCELRIVGEGPLRDELQAVARRESLPVCFLGAVDEEGRREEYARADLFVAPATHGESFGIVLLEALAAGLPVLASSIQGYEDVLAHSGASRTVPVGDSEAWAAALADLVIDESARVALASRARAHAERFSWNRLVGEIESIYEGVLSKASGRTDEAGAGYHPTRRAPAPVAVPSAALLGDLGPETEAAGSVRDTSRVTAGSGG